MVEVRGTEGGHSPPPEVTSARPSSLPIEKTHPTHWIARRIRIFDPKRRNSKRQKLKNSRGNDTRQIGRQERRYRRQDGGIRRPKLIQWMRPAHDGTSWTWTGRNPGRSSQFLGNRTDHRLEEGRYDEILPPDSMRDGISK